jgi:hypothetical protein
MTPTGSSLLSEVTRPRRGLSRPGRELTVNARPFLDGTGRTVCVCQALDPAQVFVRSVPVPCLEHPTAKGYGQGSASHGCARRAAARPVGRPGLAILLPDQRARPAARRPKCLGPICKLLWDILDMSTVLGAKVDRLSADDGSVLGECRCCIHWA